MIQGSKRHVALLAVLALSAACATSPTGRKQLLLLPESQMASLGAQSYQQMKSQTPTVSDPKYKPYIECIVRPLIAASGSQLDAKDWEVTVFKDDTANAFALPGGKIGVNTGLFPVAKNDAQIAAVLGHEIGHVIARHGNERVSTGVVAQFGEQAVAAITGNNPQSNLIMAALGVGTQVGVMLPFSRKQESEADIIGEDLMAKAGFDPRQSVELWNNMMSQGGQRPPQILSDHPSDQNRIAALQARMPEAEAKYQAAPKTSCPRPAGI